jgi:hypothetical protein
MSTRQRLKKAATALSVAMAHSSLRRWRIVSDTLPVTDSSLPTIFESGTEQPRRHETAQSQLTVREAGHEPIARSTAGHVVSLRFATLARRPGSRVFLDWLHEQNLSLAFTTYQTGKLFFVGRKPDNAISVLRTYDHCTGLWSSPDAQTLWLSTRFQLWRSKRRRPS